MTLGTSSDEQMIDVVQERYDRIWRGAECAECRKAADVIDAVRRHIGEWSVPDAPEDLGEKVEASERTEVEGAIEWLHQMVQKFNVVIYSTRCKTWRGRRAMRRSLEVPFRKAVADGDEAVAYTRDYLKRVGIENVTVEEVELKVTPKVSFDALIQLPMPRGCTSAQGVV